MKEPAESRKEETCNTVSITIGITEIRLLSTTLNESVTVDFRIFEKSQFAVYLPVDDLNEQNAT